MAENKRGLVFPWEPDYTNVINQVESTVGGVVSAVDSVVPGAIPQIPGITTPPPPVPPATPTPPVATDPVPVNIPQSNISGLPSTPAPTSLTDGVASSLEAAAAAAWPALQAQLKVDAENYAKAYLQSVFTGQPIPGVPDITFNGESLTKTAAKGHAWRTFLVGMGTTALTAVTSAIGSQAHLDLFSRDGWVATGAVAAGALVSTVISYVTRLQVAPEYEKQLAAAPPSLALQMQKK